MKLVALALCLLLSQTGCNVLGWASSAVAGETKRPATFAPAKRPTIVIAENFANPSLASLDEEPLARYITEELTANQVAPMIDPDQVTRLQSKNPAQFRGMTIAAVGQAVGAEQILYVNIVNVDVHFADNSDLIRGRGEIRVRFVDANTAATIWPTDSAEGFPITTETSIVRRAERNDVLVRSDVHRALAIRAGLLFYAAKSE